MSEVSLSPRGFKIWQPFVSRWHGQMRVQESSIAFEGPCCWIFTSQPYGGTEEPHIHLNLKDAKNLRDRLDTFIRTAEENGPCEKVEEPVKGTGEDEGRG